MDTEGANFIPAGTTMQQSAKPGPPTNFDTMPKSVPLSNTPQNLPVGSK